METETIKEKCGCITTIKHLTLRYLSKTQSYASERKLCKKHQKEYTEQKIKERNEFTQRIKKTDQKLLCDICEKHIAYVEENDLQGSYFICLKCKE